MAPLSTSNLLIGSTSLTNISSSRHRPPSLAIQREEGWTELWGGKDCTSDDGNAKNGDNGDGNEGATATANAKPYLPSRYVTVMEDGCDNIGGMSGRDSAEGHEDSTPSVLKLTQHRVAWFEQIVLRMNYIPHTVANSGYAAAESTGALPFLLDLTNRKHGEDGEDNDKNGASEVQDDKVEKWANAWKESLSQVNKPVLVGRNQPGGMGSNFFHQCHKKSKSSSTSTNLHPSWFLPSGSHIVDYLRLKHSCCMKDNLLFPEHIMGDGPSSGDAMAYESLIQDKLNYILLALRYGHDPAWEVYQSQYIRASLDPNGECASGAGSRVQSFFSLWTWYQTYSERSLALHNLLPSTHAMSPSTHGGLALELFRYNDYRHSSKSSESVDEDDEESLEEKEVHQHHPFSSFIPSYGGVGGGDTGRVNVYRAMEFADMYYASLENRLMSANDGDGRPQETYFLGTKKPTYIDALLFAHLAEALSDVHLVLVLATHSRLMKYFQRLYDQYFGEGYEKSCKSHTFGQGSATPADWIQKNNVVNALNAFNQIPEATPTEKTSKSVVSANDEGHDMVHAIQLMQQIAVHCSELDEALRDAAVLRTAEGEEKVVLESYHRPIGPRLYRWVMGNEVNFWGSGKNKNSKKNDEKTDGDSDGDSQSGDGTEKEPSSEEDDKQRMYQEHVDRMKRVRRTNDELWLSGIIATVVAVLVISASGKSK